MTTLPTIRTGFVLALVGALSFATPSSAQRRPDRPVAASATRGATRSGLNRRDRTAFVAAQQRLRAAGRVPRRQVFVPSLSLEQSLTHAGSIHDVALRAHVVRDFQLLEERILPAAVGALADPEAHVVFVARGPLDEAVLQHHFDALPRDVRATARARFRVVTPRVAVRPDDSRALSQVVLDDTHLMDTLRDEARQGAAVRFFNVTPREAKIVARTGLPALGADPELVARWGGKSGNHEAFAHAGVPHVDAEIHLHTETDLVEGIARLLERNPGLPRVMVKLDEGESGEGNAVLPVAAMPEVTAAQALHASGQTVAGARALRTAIRRGLGRLEFVDRTMTREAFVQYMGRIGGVAEVFLDGIERSPSVQGYIHPDGRVEVLSTHDQMLDGQHYLGAAFPAADEHVAALHEIGQRVGTFLSQQRAPDGGFLVGRFAVDTVASRGSDGAWKHVAIEINIRDGGTTHGYDATRSLTRATYDRATGQLRPAGGGAKAARVYLSVDSFHDDALAAFTPRDVLARFAAAKLLYDPATQQGVQFSLLANSLPEGKLGFFVVAPDHATARAIHDRAQQALHGLLHETH